MTRKYKSVKDPRVLVKMMGEISEIVPEYVTPEDLVKMVLLFVSNYAMDSYSAEEILTYALEDVIELYDKWGDQHVITCDRYQ